MFEHLRPYLQLALPLPADISKRRANCFNAVQLFWKDLSSADYTGPGDFVAYLERNFRQLATEEKRVTHDVSVIWSRSSNDLSIGAIRIDALHRRDEGYPFGLIIEHAFVNLDVDTVFQKLDPSELGPYEIVALSNALKPYENASGFEVTHHRRR